MLEQELTGKKVLLGVSGSIAAYKAAELVRLFKKAGAEVQVLMTRGAARFIPPLTLGTLSERDVLTEIFPEHAEGSWTQHVTLGLWADLFVIAPATAQTLAKLAYGFSDAMLTATALSARCPLLVCPAMDHDMYGHPATQANLGRLRQFGYEVMEPGYGSLASGLTGYGRMPEPEAIVRRVVEKLGAAGSGERQKDTLAGQRVLVTAGPTREAIDPVRFLSNPSTGTMGFALAAAARERGADVTLVSGPTALATPPGVRRIDVMTAEEMHRAVQTHPAADLVFAAAAVSDYAPVQTSEEKIKKDEGELVLRLRRTPDVLAALGQAKRPGADARRLCAGDARRPRERPPQAVRKKPGLDRAERAGRKRSRLRQRHEPRHAPGPGRERGNPAAAAQGGRRVCDPDARSGGERGSGRKERKNGGQEERGRGRGIAEVGVVAQIFFLYASASLPICSSP